MTMSGSNMQGLNNNQEIIDLVKLLRQNGDKVLSASSKLSLSTTLLHNLNEEFALIVDKTEDLESSFHVCNSSKIDIFRDIKFLHDFVQKTIGLKVTQCTTGAKVTIDITKFRHIKYLELKKVSISLVKGLQGVRGQLENVICAGKKGVTAVNQLLASCGGDAGAGFVWGSLRHLALPHNALEKLDMSLELAPWLQILDLSHNLLVTADELSCLSNLKYVNLGYNKLEMVPTFNKATLHSLQVLVLKNNYIDNISGLYGLECLTELDLSYNCLTEHSVLWSLERMSALLWVSLEGNPLSYHPKHRLLSIKHLHPCLADNKFVLDHLPLSKSEKLLIIENRAFPIRSVQSESRENISLSNSLNTVSGSTDVISVKESIIKNQSSELTDSMERSFSKSKKKANVKEAVITEDEHNKEDSKTSKTIDILSSSYLGSSKDHLETKKQILALREKFGEDNWLTSHAGTFVQDIMGLQPTSCPILTTVQMTKNDTDANFMLPSQEHIINSIQSVENVEQVSQASHSEPVENIEETEQTEVLGNKQENFKSESNSHTIEAVIDTSIPIYDPEEETGDLYLVQKKKNNDEMEELFLIITSDDIKERDTITGRVKYCWSTNSILSCVLGRGELITVDIIFDTTRKDRQNRRYYTEPYDAKKIVSTISEKMKKRPILLKVFKCMKCSTHFSQDADYTSTFTTSITGIKQLKCPTCDSTLVIQTDELSTADADNEVTDSTNLHPSKDHTKDIPIKLNLKHSESLSSIGGTEGGTISATTSLVHSDSHAQAQVCCSATSLEESRESTPSTSAVVKKYESDIEILSNPSQSSIEVLDDASKTNLVPNRKRSSEERRTAIASSLLTIPDATPVMPSLTESSSSGSLTDSICTAYENRAIKETNDISSYNNLEKDKAVTPATNLSSMLGGLLQSIKIRNNKALNLRAEEVSNLSTDVQYSYVNFGSIDHRIKLHIILNLFEHESEELVLLLRADILMHTSKEIFPGCLVLSTSKVYVLRINGSEGEDPQRWLHKEISWTMDRLRSFAPLPFKQGVLIELQQPNKLGEEHTSITLLCILQDFQRTSNFLFYITDVTLPPGCEVEFSVPEHCTSLMHHLLKSAKNHQESDTIRLLALFSSATLKYQNLVIKLKMSGLIITESTLVILEDDIQWLLPQSNTKPAITKEQAMSDLISIEHCDTSLTLNFLDEVAGLNETWILEFVSVGAAVAVINSIEPPWEELFSIPLQVSRIPAQEEKA